MLATATPRANSCSDAQVETPPALVLVVDDHADTRDMLRYLLESKGCRVCEATNGEEAVRFAEILLPDVILMDTNLPEVDGLMATERIRRLDDLQKAKIIFMSGHAEPRYRGLAVAAGGDEYFVKPIDLTELQRILEKYLPIPRVRNASP